MIIEKILLSILTVQKAGVTCIPKSNFSDYPIISFSGTQNVRHIINYDLNFLPKKVYPKGRAHSGFVKRSSELLEKIEDFIEVNDNFILTGHSLGGSVAVLCANELINRDKNIVGVYTFGAPRVGNKKFREYYVEQNLWKKTTNFRTTNDFITKLPFFYKTPGHVIELYLNEMDPLKSHDIKSYNKAFEDF